MPMYGFDAKSGIEIDEIAPRMATADTTRSAMGQSPEPGVYNIPNCEVCDDSGEQRNLL